MENFVKKLFNIGLCLFIVSCDRETTKELKNLRAEIIAMKERQELMKPGLGEIMGSIQQHHEKLYFSGKNENWKLAQYEFDELKENLDHGTMLYEHIEDLKLSLINLKTIIEPPLHEIKNFIQNKNQKEFLKSFTNLTHSCNLCHQAAKHEFIIIKIPESITFTNQKFGI